ncbi:uncharacterized protein LOC116246308 isoform X2 [Nymphaea colorata]|uniref:uncharacterized protein LOC116246308 isoform X2 n=1 Tax=Nymphaea colorata TaxID=210225 RepID=UPI00129EF423|nr:uncharacterized protein LOC116246308 isoform X2 [Nymphaea colorata]
MNAIPNGSWALSPTAFKKLGPSKTFNSFSLSQGTKLPYTSISASAADNGQSSSSSEESEAADPVKRAFERAKAYKKVKAQRSDPSTSTVPENLVSNHLNQGNKNDGDASSSSGEGGDGNVPLSVKIAMKKAREYAKEKGGLENGGRNGASIDGKKEREEDTVEEGSSDKKVGSISRLDFLGLDFADKKSGRGLPAGLVPVDDPFPSGELPEVEIIVGDQSKFGIPTGSEPPAKEDENADLYKPKVSTWGVFPRPSNISETYGGGRTIRPGQVLESAEDKAAKEAQTRKLLSEYKVKMGLNIDPKTKLECEKALEDGNSLMERGKLEEAINYYERIMNNLVFQTELHGFAALQWSICQDSLSRSDKARVMYEKLQSHPNTQVRKMAKQFMFGFQAMEMMKVRSLSTSPKATGFQNYFDAFVDDQSNYSIPKEEKEDGMIMEVVPYFIFLLTPIVFLLLIAVRKIA